jgi:hypothetical protein
VQQWVGEEGVGAVGSRQEGSTGDGGDLLAIAQAATGDAACDVCFLRVQGRGPYGDALLLEEPGVPAGGDDRDVVAGVSQADGEAGVRGDVTGRAPGGQDDALG